MKHLKSQLVFIFSWLMPVAALAEEAVVTGGTDSAGLGYLSAAIAVGASTLGAGIAVAVVGAAAMGAIGEKPELAGRALIFIGLAEGIAIYGLIVALMILAKL
ncbi:MAG: ATP synthase subunit C [Desulfatirhabdiaceae bacterium]